ncbi:MAG: hypothetical protein ABIU85_05155, partial [Methylotenera sp.]
MSLLIKALDNLDKNKQAEKNNSTTTVTATSPTLSLELEPIDSKQDTGLDEALNEKIETAKTLLSTKEALAESGLSLADEAGLVAATRNSNKQAKPKQGLAIATAVEKSASNNAKTASIAKNHVQEAT